MKKDTQTAKNIKNKRRNAAVISAVLSVILVAVVWLVLYDKPMEGLEKTVGKETETSAAPADFSITFIDVGQAESALIQCEGKTMLIDAGDNGTEDNIFDVLDNAGVEKLDYALVSHPHSDHIGGMKEVIETYTPEFLIMSELPDEMIPNTYTYKDMISAAEENNTKIKNVSVGDTLTLGSAQISILGPTEDYYDNLNDFSLVLMIEYGDTSYLFTGDMEEMESQDILDSPAVLDCDLLLVPHHGSSASSSEEFINATSPEYCIISVGADNPYGHPADSTLERLKARTEKIYRTDILGNIVVTSNGKNISVITSA